MTNDKPRIVAQFSCGAASAVATKLALADYGATHDVQILNAFLANEHEDNRRFLSDCEAWFGRPVTVLRDEKYGADIIEVFRRERFMKSQYGAPCTRLLKRRLLDSWKQPGDVMVFGYTAEEVDRLDDFRERNPDRPVIAPLIERGLGKEDCKAMIQRAGIELPMMYRMGYENANCIGCVKGGEGYYRAIREDFPEQFEELCKVQDELGPGSYLHRNRKTEERFGLRDLGDGPVRRNEKLLTCSFFCEMAEADIIAMISMTPAPQQQLKRIAEVPIMGKYDEVLLPFKRLMETELHANAVKGDRPALIEDWTLSNYPAANGRPRSS